MPRRIRGFYFLEKGNNFKVSNESIQNKKSA
jgi:hypothetical protein